MATQIFCRLFPKTLTSLTSFRSMTTRATILSLIERLNHSPNSSALKLRNGYDYIRTTVLMHKYKIGPFEREPTATELVHDYVKLLTDLVGSEEEARMMVYSYGLNSDFNYAGTLLPNELYLDLYYRGLGMN
ncbi:hypothetical protein P8452_53699 [Trifolium repens]|nr:hypothetical protein P8452_53699 [Trifolium repens]